MKIPFTTIATSIVGLATALPTTTSKDTSANPMDVITRRGVVGAEPISPAELQSLSERDNSIITLLILTKAKDPGPYETEFADADGGAVMGEGDAPATLTARGDAAADNVFIIVFKDDEGNVHGGAYDNEIASADGGAVLGRREINAPKSLNDVFIQNFNGDSAYDVEIGRASAGSVLGQRDVIAAREISSAEIQSLAERDNNIIAVSFFLGKSDEESGPYDAAVAAANPESVLGRRDIASELSAREEAAADSVFIIVFKDDEGNIKGGAYDKEIESADGGAVLGQ